MSDKTIIFFLIVIISILALVVLYQQFVFNRGIQAKIKQIDEKLEEILETDSDEKIMIFAQKQFNSFTLENEMKPESIFSNWSGVIDVSEAKKLGYVIPDNYKESTVPQLSFDTVDRV